MLTQPLRQLAGVVILVILMFSCFAHETLPCLVGLVCEDRLSLSATVHTRRWPADSVLLPCIASCLSHSRRRCTRSGENESEAAEEADAIGWSCSESHVHTPPGPASGKHNSSVTAASSPALTTKHSETAVNPLELNEAEQLEYQGGKLTNVATQARHPCANRHTIPQQQRELLALRERASSSSRQVARGAASRRE